MSFLKRPSLILTARWFYTTRWLVSLRLKSDSNVFLASSAPVIGVIVLSFEPDILDFEEPVSDFSLLVRDLLPVIR
jgi:hypothetical protein